MRTLILSLMLACVVGFISAEEKTEKLVINGESNGVKVEMGTEESPLVVVDGEIFEGNLNDIKPETIKSITILKQAEAVKTYGEAAKNGVIVITLKKAKK